MKMPIINFDEHFADFISDWMKAHRDQYTNFDEMEEDMPRIYMAFVNTRANGWAMSLREPISRSLKIPKSSWTGWSSIAMKRRRYRIC